MRYYDALDLAPALAIDAADLQKRFYARSRQWHPDRFTRAPAPEQAKALEMTAVLNDAFRTLRDPVQRAEYFLSENGLDLSKQVPPELLEEVFELNMALEELRSGDESARTQLEQARERFVGMLREIDGEMEGLFAGHDASADEPGRAEALEQIRARLNRRKYISNLVRDIDQDVAPDAAPDRDTKREFDGHSAN